MSGLEHAQEANSALGGRNEEEAVQEEDAVQEEEEAVPQQQAATPARPDDPARMVLTREERYWALDIKDAIENEPELDNLSDFMYAQLALICKEDAEDAVDRATALQAYRQEYGFIENYKEGCLSMRSVMRSTPGWCLSCDFSAAEGTYMWCHDIAKFETSGLDTLEKHNRWFQGMYYIWHAVNSDLESIRRGIISFGECEGIGWAKKKDIKLHYKLFSELLAYYPFTGSLRHCNSGVVFNMMATVLKRALPENLKDNFQTGIKTDDRLDAICLVPTPAVATERMLQNFEKALKLRFENEKTFKLPHEPIVWG